MNFKKQEITFRPMSNNQIAILPATVVQEFNALVPVLAEQTKTLIAQLNEQKSAVKLYSLPELADNWDMDTRTVQRHLKKHGVKPVTFANGKSIRYKAKDIETLLNKLSR